MYNYWTTNISYTPVSSYTEIIELPNDPEMLVITEDDGLFSAAMVKFLGIEIDQGYYLRFLLNGTTLELLGIRTADDNTNVTVNIWYK